MHDLRHESDPYSILMLLADPSFSAVVLLPEGSGVYTDARALQLLQNIGRRHLMPDDLGEAVWSDLLMPLEQLSGSGGGAYLALFDRADASVSECRGEGRLAASYGFVSLDGDRGFSILRGESGSEVLALQPDADVQVALLDKKTGEVLYERTVKL